MRKIYYLILAAVLTPALMFAQEPAPHSDCANAAIQTLVIDGSTVSVTGSGTDAVDLDGFDASHVWEAFTIDDCSDVTIDLCGTPITATTYFGLVTNGCPIDQTVSIIPSTFGANFESCGVEEAENPSMVFLSLPAGTYYFPILSDTANVVLDEYTVNFTAAVCAGEPDSCLYYTDGPWIDFNTEFGGAPAPGADGVCESFTLTAFEVAANEMYVIDNFTADVVYTFSICEGPNAGSFAPSLAVIDPNTGDVIAYTEGCSITWTSPATGSYVIGITEVGACFTSSNTYAGGGENGHITLTCEGSVGISDVDKAHFSVYPNPSNGQFTIANVETSGSYTVEVIDLAGRVIHSQVSALSTNTETRVNLDEVAAGVYMVKMTNTTNNTQAVQRIVIK